MRLTFNTWFQNGSIAGRIAAVLITVMMFADLGFAAGPKLTLSPKAGPPTSSISVSGTGFSAYAAIDIYFDTTDETLAFANGSGAFSKIPIPVPASALPGNHYVTAVQRSNGKGAQAVFLVETNWSEFGFTSKDKRSNPYENVLSPSTVGFMDGDWTFTTAGYVNASPAVADGVVYIGSNDGNLYALNASTGAKLWNFTTKLEINSSPAVANGTVYVASNDGNLYALNASNGAKLWSFAGDPTSDPTVASGVVYMGGGNNVYALNAKTGAELWSFTTGYQVSSTPAVSNEVVYIGSQDTNLYALNATTGAKIWSFTTPASIQSPPTVADGVVYIGSTNGRLYALNANTGAELWSFATGDRVFCSPALANGVVYVVASDSGYVYALNARTGAELWDFYAGGFVYSSPAVANGVLYVGSESNNVYAVNASTGAELWSFPTGSQISQSSPAVANGVVYIGSFDKNLYAFSLSGDMLKRSVQRPDPAKLVPNYSLTPSKPPQAAATTNTD
ncbi:MAG: PQQ-binding-like beta-propeller repeat protein [Terriglobales bacterium]